MCSNPTPSLLQYKLSSLHASLAPSLAGNHPTERYQPLHKLLTLDCCCATTYVLQLLTYALSRSCCNPLAPSPAGVPPDEYHQALHKLLTLDC
jgi:hypothetical protein